MRLLLLSFLSFLAVHLTAQDPPVVQHCRTACRIGYCVDTVSPYHVNYMVLRELAKEHLVDIPKVNLSLTVTTCVQLEMNDEGQYLAEFILRDPGVGGPTTYRGFDISAFLLPSLLAVEIIHRDRMDSSLARRYRFNDVSLSGYETRLPALLIPKYDPVADTLIVGIGSPRFSEGDLGRLMARIDLVNDYYASSALLDSLKVKAAGIDLANTSKLPFSYCDITGIAKAVDLILSRDFDSTLLSSGSDPRNLKRERQEALRMSRSLVYNFLDQVGATTTIAPAAGIDSLCLYFVEGLVRFIGMSSIMNDINGNIYSDYLERFFELQAFPDDGRVLVDLSSRMMPDADPDTLLTYVSRHVYDAYLSRARQLILRNRYADAFTLILHARMFKDKVPALKELNGTDALLSEAAAGVYASYLGIAATSIEYDKFDMAEVYIRKALDYKRNNVTWFSTDTLYGKVFQKLFRQRLIHCDRMIDDGRYRDAVECYGEFRNSFEPELVAMVSDWITAKSDTAWHLLFISQNSQTIRYLEKENFDSAFIAFDALSATFGYIRDDTSAIRIMQSAMATVLPVRYRIMSDRAVSAYVARDYETAWRFAVIADAVAAEANIPHDSLFCAVQRETFRHHQLEEISDRTGYIWSGQIDSAYIYIEMVAGRVGLYGLSGDSSLSAAIAGYHDRIVRRACQDHAGEAELLALRASRNAEAGRYVTSFRQFQAADSISTRYASCGMALAAVSDSIRKYELPARYMLKTDTLGMHYSLADYRAVIRDLEDLAGNYDTAAISVFRIVPVTAEAYILEKNNPALTLEIIQHRIAVKQYDDAERYLQMLSSQGGTSREINSLRDRIDKALKTGLD